MALVWGSMRLRTGEILQFAVHSRRFSWLETRENDISIIEV